MKVNEKSNEITAIPQLLKILEIKGCIVTIDAMGTQKEIAKTITVRGGDYILSFKRNQGNIYEDVRQLFDWATLLSFEFRWWSLAHALIHIQYSILAPDHHQNVG